MNRHSVRRSKVAIVLPACNHADSLPQGPDSPTDSRFGQARTTAIRAASGEYCACIDADDELLPHHLELYVTFLERFDTQSFLSTDR